MLIDSPSHRLWYKSYYALPLGHKKGARLTPKEEEIINKKQLKERTSGQHGSIAKHSLPPRTTTSKLQLKYSNNHHSEPSEIWLNGSLTTELKKAHPSRLVEGVETWNRLVPHPRVVDKNLGVTSWEQGVLTPYQAPGF